MRRSPIVSGSRESAMTNHSLRTLLMQIVSASMPVALGACGGIDTTRADTTRADAAPADESNRWVASGGGAPDLRSQLQVEGGDAGGTTPDAAPDQKPRC